MLDRCHSYDHKIYCIEYINILAVAVITEKVTGILKQMYQSRNGKPDGYEFR